MARVSDGESQKGGPSVARDRFIDFDGTGALGHHAIFPILKQVGDGCFNLIGTGFFISSFGLFVSAKHVLRDCFDEKGKQKFSVCLLQFFSDNRYLFRHIAWCCSHNRADVAVGLAEGTSGGESNPALPLTTVGPSNGELAATFAYPETKIEQLGATQVMNFKAEFYDGSIVKYFPNGRDKVMFPGPCYQTTMVIKGGASGGPVVGKSGRAFAINSTGFDGASDISFVSRIDEIIYLELPHLQLPDGQDLPSITIFDLAMAGWIDFEPHPSGKSE